MTDDILEFGDRDPEARYVLRPGGYVVLRSPDGVPDRIGVVVASDGVYLLGGGQDPGEAPDAAAVRECIEECGVHARIVRRIGVADQLTYSQSERKHYRKRSTYFVAEAERVDGGGEPDHELAWMSAAEAARRLTDGAQRWAAESLQAATGDHPDSPQ